MPQTLAINDVQLLNFSRSPKKGALAHFAAPVRQTVSDSEVSLAGALGCSVDFPEYMPGCTIDGDFQLHSFELVPNSRALSQYQLSGTKAIQAGRLHEFQVVRRELPGKQGKGFRFEWRFTLRFTDPEGCYKLEQYMNGIGAEKSKLMVGFTKQAVQQTLIDNPDDGTRVEITADPDAQRRILEGIKEGDIQMNGIGAEKSKLMVGFTKQAVQQTLIDNPDDGTRVEITADPDAQRRILEGIKEGDIQTQVEGSGQTHAQRMADKKAHKDRVVSGSGKENVQ